MKGEENMTSTVSFNLNEKIEGWPDDKRNPEVTHLLFQGVVNITEAALGQIAARYPSATEIYFKGCQIFPDSSEGFYIKAQRVRDVLCQQLDNKSSLNVEIRESDRDVYRFLRARS